MKTACHLALLVALFAACISSESLSANYKGPAADGWHTWQVEGDNPLGNIQFYALMDSGLPVKLRIRGSECIVTWKSDIPDADVADLGQLTVDESIDWFEQFIEPHSPFSSDAIMAVSLHSGERPVAILAGIVKSGNDRDLREEALFWLGQSDSDAAFELFDRLLSGTL